MTFPKNIVFILCLFSSYTISTVESCDTSKAAFKSDETVELKTEVQHSEFLYTCGSKQLRLFIKTDGNLTIVLIPCTSNIFWTIDHQTHSQYEKNQPGINIFSNSSGQMVSFGNKTVSAGVYTIGLVALERDSYVRLYATQRPGGPPFLAKTHVPNIKYKITNKRRNSRGNNMSIRWRWDRSKVDPHLMHYCLSVNSRVNYPTLCRAIGDSGSGIIPPSSSTSLSSLQRHKTEIAHKAAIYNTSQRGRGRVTDENMLVRCVKDKTYTDISGLEAGKVYYFDLFAFDTTTNVSYLYGSIVQKLDKPRSLTLRDGREEIINFRTLDKATFKFKVGRRSVPEMSVYIVACGGAVDVKIFNKKQQVAHKRMIESYSRIKVKNVKKGQRYIIKLAPSNEEEGQRLTKAEIRVTARQRPPQIPDLPRNREVQEITEMRNCTSTTISWMLSADTRNYSYCILAKEVSSDLEDNQIPPNQCQLNVQLQSNGVRICFYKRNDKKKEVPYSRKIRFLDPGKTFLIQVTAQVGRGRILAYKLLKIKTNNVCKNDITET